MERPGFQFSVASMLGLVACVAFNIWLFRLGPLLGILGLNVSKHVVIAYLCQHTGVDRERARAAAHRPAATNSVYPLTAAAAPANPLPGAAPLS